MAMSYTELTGDKTVAGSIKSWVNYARIDVESVLMDAQAMIYQQLRVRQMKSATTIDAYAGVDYLDLPKDYVSYVSFRNVTDDTDIDFVDWEELERIRSWVNGTLTSGDPVWFAAYEDRIQFDVKVRSPFTSRLLYYRRPADLSASNETNFLTIRYPHLLRTACLAMAAVFDHDDASYSREMQRFAALLAGINIQADLDDRAGQDLRTIGP